MKTNYKIQYRYKLKNTPSSKGFLSGVHEENEVESWATKALNHAKKRYKNPSVQIIKEVVGTTILKTIK